MKQRAFKGEITLFLSLIFLLLLSLVGAVIQSASIHISKSRKRADTELALESVFAEYHPEMLERYDIFVIVGREETKISESLWFYGANHMEHRIRNLRLLTDADGQAFYEQAIRAMGGEASGTFEVSNENRDSEEQAVRQKLGEILDEEGQSMPEVDNPITAVEGLKQRSLLSLICPAEETLSNRSVTVEELASHRTLYQGSASYGGSKKGGGTGKILFTAYLLEHFSDYSEEPEEGALAYEAEYLLCGLPDDRGNLEAVAKKLLPIRLAANYTYLLTDSVRQAEAEAMALTLSSLLTVPGAAEVVKQALLFAWAYGESIVDLRVLLQGKKVPLVKSNETWQLQLANVSKLGTAEEVTGNLDAGSGLRYEDYLKALLFLQEENTLCMRALDIIECNLGVRADNCVTALEIQSTCTLQRGILDTFLTEYQYR